MIEIGSRRRLLPAPPHIVWQSLTPDVAPGETPNGAPDASKAGHIRYRMNVLINRDLRYSYGQ